MKKTIIFALFIYSSINFALDTNHVRYFPLAVGNSWTYSVVGGNPPMMWRTKAYITKDTVMLSKKFFYFLCPVIGTAWIRIDSISGKLLRYVNIGGCSGPNETIIDSLASRKNDSANDCFLRRRCVDTNNVVLFGQTLKAKQFNPIVQIYANSRRYARNFGLYFLNEGDPYAINYSLIGCVINGVVYGDTTLLGLTPISTEIPTAFSLSQNYPNPFNPVTNIKFDIPKSSFVKLVVYDLLGREVAALVNEQLKAGTYEADWNAADFPSGVYFYKMIADGYIETKRMVLIK